MNNNKLVSKDFITIGIFSVVFFVIMKVGTFLAMIFMLYPFMPAIQILLCGIVWLYIHAKVPKRFAILIQCVIMTLLVFITGTTWTAGVGILTGGILAEIVSGIGWHKRFTLSVAAYAVFGLGCNFGVFGMILLARDYWYAYAVGAGMSEERLKQTMEIVSWPLMGISSAAVVAAAVFGMLFGRFMLKKHFQRAGIL